MEFKIIATTGRAKDQAVEIRAAKFFIGRHENCQLRPDIEDLAGIHALIEQRESRLYLRDFGAEGGTGLNDRVLRAREMEVFDGDLIQIGPMVLTLSIKSKSEDRLHGLHHAPEGWPFLEGVSAPPVRAPKPDASDPIPQSPMTVADPVPNRLESFLTIHPSIQPGSAVAVSPSTATATATADVAISPPPIPRVAPTDRHQAAWPSGDLL